MGEGRGRIFIVLCMLAGLWIVVYWLWDAPQPPVTFAQEPAGEEPLHVPAEEPAVEDPVPPAPDVPAAPTSGVVAPEFDRLVVDRAGETWASLSERAYGTPDHADAIRDANPYVVDLKQGDAILVPRDPGNIRGVPVNADDPTDSSPRGATTPEGPDIIAEHTVVPGEVLGGIARRYYGSSQNWRVIYEFNRERLGLASETAIRPGDVLLIPALPEED